jgi:glycosyltransferase involved in cell wall biosynthesis
VRVSNSSGSKTKFTVIVPTRERAGTLHYCLKTLLAQDYANFEILVSDNFSQDDTEAVVAIFADPRIRYVNTGRRMSMSHNWEFALTYVSSGWVLFVGDDDALVPNALQTLDWVIQESGCEAMTTASCTYWWPSHFPTMPAGELSIPMPTSMPYRVKDSKEMLAKVMRGLAEYRELPWLYNGGAASIDLINRLRAPDGAYFRSLNPDIYSAVTLALGTKNYVALDIPIAINGASKYSGGTSHMLGHKKDKDSPTAKFLAEDNIPFHSSLIFGKSFLIMAYECYLQAAHLYQTSAYQLEAQLRAALAVAPKPFLAEIRSECAGIAERNKVRPPSRSAVLVARTMHSFRSLFRRVTQRQSITLPAAQIGANDVWLASLAVNDIYRMFAFLTQRSPLSRWVTGAFFFSNSLIRYLGRIMPGRKAG